jgi:hypothetical protein
MATQAHTEVPLPGTPGSAANTVLESALGTAAGRWRVFLVRCSPGATVPDHAWARRTLARRWPNVPATVFVATCGCEAARV